MPLKKEVSRNPGKGREWAAGGRVGSDVCSLSPWTPPPPPPLSRLNWAISFLLLLSAAYRWAGVCQHLGLELQLYHWLDIGPCFPTWTATIQNPIIPNFNYFHKVPGCPYSTVRSPENKPVTRQMTLGKLFNPSDGPSKWVTLFSFPTLMKKKSCFFIPRTWKQ